MAQEAWGVGGLRSTEDKRVDERFEFNGGVVGRWLVIGWAGDVERA